MKVISKIYTLSLLAAIGLSSCRSDDTTLQGTTPLTIKITDAPANYDAIHLNIDEIEIRTSGGTKEIDIDSGPFDILQYRVGKDTILVNQDVPSGLLQEIRLKLADTGNNVIIDGQSYPLTTPSAQSSGVKIKVQQELIPNVPYTLLLDFDAAKSIVQTGSGKYILKPVIRAVPVAVSGTIAGSVLPIAAYSRVYAIIDKDTIGTIPNETGNFYFPGVPQGTYKVVFEPGSANYNPAVVENVIVEKGTTKDLGIVILTEK